MNNAPDTKSGERAPLGRPLELTADELVRALVGLEAARRVHLLDSCGARGERYLIAGFDPFEVVEARGEELHVTARGGRVTVVERGSVLSLLDDRLARHRVGRARLPENIPVAGACVVTLSYEFARRTEPARAPRARRAQVGADVPEAVLAFFDTLVVHDYARGETSLVSAAGSAERLEEAGEALRRVAHAAPAAAASRDSGVGPRNAPADAPAGATSRPGAHGIAPPVRSNFTRGEYVAAVERIREYIYAGDIYQANLTQQLSCALPHGTTPEHVFLRLRRGHPAPFAAFIRHGEAAVVSASPERFLRVRPATPAGGGRCVEAWPIKGTRSRGADAAEDARLRAELLSSPKDRAENVMIVDLLRNDLGRVCRFGTVEVAELCALEEHSTLFHLASKVRGTLRDGASAGDLLRAAFPCGSITGAPKIRAMEIIDEVETAPRGVSMGAVGYFSFDGAADLSVAIRTLTVGRDRVARFNVGGGVVADSDPGAEYEESLVKARALLSALGAAG